MTVWVAARSIWGWLNGNRADMVAFSSDKRSYLCTAPRSVKRLKLIKAYVIGMAEGGPALPAFGSTGRFGPYVCEVN